MPSDRERLQELRERKRLDELRAKKNGSTVDSSADIGSEVESSGRGFLSGLTDTATLGYAPQMYGATESVIQNLKGLFTGEEVPEDVYEQAVKRYKAYSEGTQENAPISQGVGRMAGYIAPGSIASKAVGSVIKGPGILRGGARLATEGGILGAAENTDGGIDQRLENAKSAAITSGLIGSGGGLLKSAGKGAQNLSDVLRLKGVGVMLKDFRNIFSKGEIQGLSKFIKDNKIVRPGSTVKTVMKDASRLRKVAGKDLSDIYSTAKERLNDPEFLKKLTPNQQDEFLKAGFYPSSQRDEALNFVRDKMKDEVGGSAGIKAVDDYIADLAQKYGDDVDIVKAKDIKSAVDRAINYSRNPLTKDPIKEQALRHFRTFINDKIKKQVDYIDEVVGGDLGKRLRKANDTYGKAATVFDAATDRFARDSSNRLFGMSEQLMSGFGGTIGGLGGGGIDPAQMALFGGLGFLGSRGLKTYGSGFGAPMMEATGKGLLTPAGKYLRRAAPAMGADLTNE